MSNQKQVVAPHIMWNWDMDHVVETLIQT